MAVSMSMVLKAGAVPKLHSFGSAISTRVSAAKNIRFYAGAATRPLQASFKQEAGKTYQEAQNAIRQGSKDAKRAAEDVTDQDKWEQVVQKTKEAASKVTEVAKDTGEKAKQTAKEAWENTKQATHNIKEAVVGEAEGAKEQAKGTAETVKRSMNTKTSAPV